MGRKIPGVSSRPTGSPQAEPSRRGKREKSKVEFKGWAKPGGEYAPEPPGKPMSQLLNTLFRRSAGGTTQRVSHYLYFKGQQAAAPVVIELKHQGFEVEDRESADGKNWLVLAHHDIVVTPSVLEA